MTLIAVCSFDDGAVVLGDSRASTPQSTGLIPTDALQKVIPLGNKGFLAYAGRVDTAGRIIAAMGRNMQRDMRRRHVHRIATDLPRTAKYFFDAAQRLADPSLDSLAIVFGGVDANGRILIWRCESPDFSLSPPVERYAVLGSGRRAISYLDREYESLCAIPDLKRRADALMAGLAAELRQDPEDTVGGLFQVITVASDGIRPISYGFASADPDDVGPAKRMVFERGQWTQYDDRALINTPLLQPHNFRPATPSQLRVHDYTPPDGDAAQPKWHLGYFIIALGAVRGPGNIAFLNMFNSIAFKTFPTTLEAIAFAGFGDSSGDYRFSLVYCRDTHVIELGSGPITADYNSELVEIHVPITLEVHQPGLGFLELRIAGTTIARKPLYIGQVPPEYAAADPAAAEMHQDRLNAELKTCIDPSIVDEGKTFVDYFTMCHKVEEDGVTLRFEGEVAALYWRDYPLNFRCFVPLGFRSSPGDHVIRIELVHMATRDRTAVDTATVGVSSSCTPTRIHGETTVPIPKPGWYFLNALIDDDRVATVIFCAETEKAHYSYSLLAEDQERVVKGELLYVPRRGIQAST